MNETPIDLLGNEIHVGDLILYAESDMIPCSAKVTDLSKSRCYFPGFFSNKHYSYEKKSFRAYEQVISLTSLGISEKQLSENEQNNTQSDIIGTPLVPGMEVVGIAGGTYYKGIVKKVTAKQCIVEYSDYWKESKTYPQYLLAYNNIIAKPMVCT